MPWWDRACGGEPRSDTDVHVWPSQLQVSDKSSHPPNRTSASRLLSYTSSVLDRAGVIPESAEEEKLSVFRDFVNSLNVDLPEEPG